MRNDKNYHKTKILHGKPYKFWWTLFFPSTKYFALFDRTKLESTSLSDDSDARGKYYQQHTIDVLEGKVQFHLNLYHAENNMQVLQQKGEDPNRTAKALRTEQLLYQYENGSYCVF